METTYTGDISARTTVYAAKRMLKRGTHIMITERFGQTSPVPKNKGTFVKFRRYNSLTPAIAPLQEGITPSGQKLRFTDVSCTLRQFGDIVRLTDVILDTHEDNRLLDNTSDNCGEQIAETFEILRIAVLKAGSTVFYPDGVSSRTGVNSYIKRGQLRRISRFLKKRKAKPISKINKASIKIATEPTAPAYFVLCSTDLDSDIQDIPSFTPTEKYSNSDRATPAEIGKVENFRFCTSPLFESWEAAATSVSDTNFLVNGEIPAAAGNPDVYPVIIIAQDAYGIVPLAGKTAVRPFIKNPVSQVGDELAQKGYIAWKTWHASVILNENWVVRLEVLATAKPG